MTSGATAQELLAPDLDHVLDHTRGAWDSLREQQIFVTGGTGFFGRWLLESFAHANRAMGLRSRVVVLSRNPDAFRTKAPHLAADQAISFVAGDVRTFTLEQVRAQLGGDGLSNCSCVIHAATEASAQLNAEAPLVMLDTIVGGTRAALDFAVESGAKRFLLTSSGAVYGPQPPNVTHVPEDHPGAPNCTRSDSAYGEGKRLAELLCACYAKQHGLEPLIARCFAFVGPFLPLDTHFAIGNFIRDALGGGPIRVGGDGTPFRSYLYAADLAIWLWTILVHGTPGRPYNVGSEDSRTIAQLADQVRAAIAPSVRVEIAREADPGTTASRYVPATARARDELSLREYVPLAEAIGRTAQYHRALSA